MLGYGLPKQIQFAAAGLVYALSLACLSSPAGVCKPPTAMDVAEEQGHHLVQFVKANS